MNQDNNHKEYTDNCERFGVLIRRWRKELGLSREAFGKKVNLTATSVERWENDVFPREIEKDKVSKVLKSFTNLFPNLSESELESKLSELSEAFGCSKFHLRRNSDRK